MNAWVKLPLTEQGFRQAKCPYYVKASLAQSLMPSNGHGFVIATFEKNQASAYCKSVWTKDLVGYGHGLLMERGTLAQRRDWYVREKPVLTRKMKKRLIGTKRRKS